MQHLNLDARRVLSHKICFALIKLGSNYIFPYAPKEMLLCTSLIRIFVLLTHAGLTQTELKSGLVNNL